MTERRRPDPGVPWPLVAAALVLLAVIVVAWSQEPASPSGVRAR